MTLDSVIDTLRQALDWMPGWAAAVVALSLAALAAVFLHGAVLRLLRRWLPSRHVFLHSLIGATARLIRLGLVVVAVSIVLPLVPLDRETRSIIAHGLLVAVIVLVGWAASVAITQASELYLRRVPVDLAADPLGRKHVTQIRILRRAALTLAIILTTAGALMTFESVKEYGVSLVASAGAAGLVVGLAARPLLTNLFAGIQIAITQPIRIGDALLVENEWGWVEEITGTYVVVKIWDWRRLLVPLSYFLEKPFQNWTRHSTDLIGTVLLWVDYTVPVARIRARLEEIVREARLWDGQVVNLQVVDSNERAIQLRALVSARNSGEAWDLRCEVREKLIAFLQESYPGALPRQRAAVVEFEQRRAAAS
ncbi:MAG: mechanosensitive ion channel family protein [Reyranella sp.]|uniref:mechanosensitive ion channel family protein n=1 Tax=Reyranella sp. TaxID=1929291 RepID=UPI003D09749B